MLRRRYCPPAARGRTKSPNACSPRGTVQDRLAYRTAPLGLIRTSEMRRLGLTFVAGLPTGEDQDFSAKLWFGGGRIDYAAGGPRYVVGADASDRVTYTRRSVEDTLRFASMLVDSDWFAGRSLRERRSMVAKLVRVHIFGLLETRSESGGWSGKDRRELASILGAVLASAEGLWSHSAGLIAAWRTPFWIQNFRRRALSSSHAHGECSSRPIRSCRCE